MYPELKFIYSKRKDLEIFLGFIETNKYFDKSEDLKIGFFSIFPELRDTEKMATEEAKKKAQKIIDKEYSKKKKTIEKNLKKIKADWQKVAPWFYKECDRIFESQPWPEGKYIAYTTIWGIYPRFLGDKTFTFPYKHKLKNYPLVVIAHEMLHFMFYDYLFKNYPKYKNKQYEEKIWGMSEIFNPLIQNSGRWQRKLEQKVIIYSKLKPEIKKMQKILLPDFTAKDFTENWEKLKELKKY